MGYVSRWMYLSDALDALVLDKVMGIQDAKRDLNSALSDKKVKARGRVVYHEKGTSKVSIPDVRRLVVDWFYYQLDNEAWTNDRMVLEYQKSEAYALDVEVKRMDVVKVFYDGLDDWAIASGEGPLAIQGGAGKPKRGPKPKYKWGEFTARAIAWMRESEGVEIKAELEKFMADWCFETWGEDSQPVASMIREYCTPVWDGFRPADNPSETDEIP